MRDAVILGGLGFSLVRADTVIKQNDWSVNGSVSMANDVITIIPRYNSRKGEPIKMKVVEVKSIEFNDHTNNSGAPQKEPGFRPPLDGGKPSASRPEARDEIVLRGNQHRPCKLIGIDEERVQCAGKDGDYGRNRVVRILVGVK